MNGRRTWYVVAAAVLVAACGLLVAGEGPEVKPKPKPAERPRVEKPKGTRVAGLWSELNLTEEQKAKYADLDKVRKAELDKIAEEMKALQVRRKAAETTFEEGMLTALTEEQKTKRQQLLDEQKKREEERRAKTSKPAVKPSGETPPPPPPPPVP